MEAVIFCGIQGSGKSTFYRQRFSDTHMRINLDMLRTRWREGILVRACLQARQKFVVDNTNPTPETRARYIAPAKKAGFRVVGYYFDTQLEDALARNAARPGKQRIPAAGVMGAYQRLKPPGWEEGFDELYVVRIEVDGQFTVERQTAEESPRSGRS